MAGDKGHSQNVGKLWSEDQVVGKRWSERPKRASRRRTVVGTVETAENLAKTLKETRKLGQHVRNCENRRKLGEKTDGSLKTVNRGENVERVPSTPNASGTVHPAENLAKTAENWAKTRTETRKRLTGAKTWNVSRQRSARPEL